MVVVQNMLKCQKEKNAQKRRLVSVKINKKCYTTENF